jgi:hypothetical protein
MNARQQLARLDEMNADPASLCGLLQAIVAMAMEGVVQEKISVKDGVLEVVEKDLSTAVRAIALIHRVRLDVLAQADVAPELAPLTIHVLVDDPTPAE